jgi:ADP-heptose:LPS heptosyltransferase
MRARSRGHPIVTGNRTLRLWLDHSVWSTRKGREKAARIDLDQARSIAVIKYAALGDMLLTRPFLITLRQYFPNARIVLSVLSIYQGGVPHDLIDEVHVVDKAEKSPIRIYRNYRELGEHDIIFDISATSRSFWVTRVNRARLKVGFVYKGVHRLFYDVAVPRSIYRFESESFLDQLLVLGLSYAWPLQFDLHSESPNQQKPYILYFPTASIAPKCWPADLFIQLIGLLSDELPQFDHLILPGIADWEKEICRRIGEEIGNKNNAKIIDDGEDALHWVNGADLVVSNDTGIRNMAIAAYTPTVGIFFSTVPFRYLPRFGHHEVVYRLDRKPPSVEEVRSAVRRFLATAAPR